MLKLANRFLFPKFPCPHCKGEGRFWCEGMTPVTCNDCDGTGQQGDARVGAVVILATAVSTVYAVKWLLLATERLCLP